MRIFHIHTPARRAIGHSLAALLLAAQLFPATVMAQSAEASADPAAKIRSLETYFQALREIREALPREGFDPAAIVQAVGRDPAALRDWVAQNTVWVDYPGHLRPPHAVIMDGSANSLDRAILLAELLSKAGHAPQIALHPGIDTDWAQTHLLTERPLRAEVTPFLPVKPEEGLEGETLAAFERILANAERRLERMAERIDTQLPFLRASLERLAAPAEVANPSVPPHHAWVLLDDLRLDPAAAPELEALQTFAPDAVPEELHQQIEIAFIVTRRESSGPVEETALTHRVSAASQGNFWVSCGFTPDAPVLSLAEMEADPKGFPQKMRDNLLQAKRWVPFVRVGDDFFTDLGFEPSGVLNKDHENPPTAQALGRATSLLGGLGQSAAPAEASTQLGAVRIEIRTLIPGQDPLVEVRHIHTLDEAPAGQLIPLTDDQRAARAMNLSIQSDLLIQSGWMSREFVLSVHILQLLKNRPSLLGALHYSNNGEPEQVQAALDKVHAFPEHLYDWALLRREMSAQQTQSYLAQPTLVAWHTLARPGADGNPAVRQGIDILSNPLQTAGKQDDPRLARLEQGVLDAVLESVILENNKSATVSASHLMHRSGAETWTLVDTPAQLQQIQGIAETSREFMNAVLAGGGALLLPANPGDIAAAELAWWEVDPATGHVMGRIADGGWGGTSSEYLINLYVAKAAILLWGIGAAMCADNPGIACIACTLIGAALIIAGIFVPFGAPLMAVVALNMASNLGCSIATA